MNLSDKTVAEIKLLVDSIPNEDLSAVQTELLGLMENDPRAQVKKLSKTKRSAIEKAQKELAIITEMLKYEHMLNEQGFNLVAGVDEAGRGALAGPLAAAAVILPPNAKLYGLRDSKQLSPEKRDKLFDVIKDHAIAWNVVTIDNHEIDTQGIQWANLTALKRAVSGLSEEANYVLSDAFELPALDKPCLPLIKGDSKSLTIAAASVLAKVTRDRMMGEFHEEHPQYGFDKHKGYGTFDHIEAIKRFGPSSIHRMSFAPCSEYKQLSIDIGKLDIYESGICETSSPNELDARHLQ
jgi:ribonuclease HII